MSELSWTGWVYLSGWEFRYWEHLSGRWKYQRTEIFSSRHLKVSDFSLFRYIAIAIREFGGF
jgi:hypothetical protein